MLTIISLHLLFSPLPDDQNIINKLKLKNPKYTYEEIAADPAKYSEIT